jgi:hypothetical protein
VTPGGLPELIDGVALPSSATRRRTGEIFIRRSYCQNRSRRAFDHRRCCQCALSPTVAAQMPPCAPPMLAPAAVVADDGAHLLYL